MFRLMKATWQRGLRLMKITLHLGAHRCATTSFQTYLDQNRPTLAQNGVAVWTPQTTRKGLFEGMICQPGDVAHHHIKRIQTAQGQLDADHLLVSEENMIGAPRNNLRYAALYPGVAERLNRFAHAFDGKVTRLGLAIRSYESYWTSVMSFAALRGDALPNPDFCAALSTQARTWTRIAQDIRAVFPQVPLHIWTFEAFAGQPKRQFNMLIGHRDIADTLDQTTAWKNNSRSLRQMRRRFAAEGRMDELATLPSQGKWQPFTPLERHRMAIAYTDDLRFFRSRTDPMIHFTGNAAIHVPRHQNTQAPPAFDIGEHHDRHAKMG